MFFSNRNNKKVTQSIAKGLDIEQVSIYDITKPKAREIISEIKEELLIVAVPVYMGRVPAIVNKYLGNIKVCKIPVICVVVYGNRIYGNLIKLVRLPFY